MLKNTLCFDLEDLAEQKMIKRIKDRIWEDLPDEEILEFIEEAKRLIIKNLPCTEDEIGDYPDFVCSIAHDVWWKKYIRNWHPTDKTYPWIRGDQELYSQKSL
jgi:hypothetical protein